MKRILNLFRYVYKKLIIKNSILLFDTHFGKVVEHPINWFEERWFDMPLKKIITKEVIVISK